MGWAVLALLGIGCALLWMAWSEDTRPTSADDRLRSAIFAILAVACLGLALLLWMAWVTFG